MDKIVLVGFSGAGKTSVGKRLAFRLGWKFIDTDSYFEQKYHISVEDFFKKYGEDAFRLCEKEVLSEVLLQSGCVISTGGGLPCFHDNMDLILAHSFSIYLRLSPASLVDRLTHSRKVRPLVSGKSPEEIAAYVEKTLVEREVFYSRAHVAIKGESLVLDDLLALLGNLS